LTWVNAGTRPAGATSGPAGASTALPVARRATIPTAGKLTCRPLALDEILKAYPIVNAIEGCVIGPQRWQEIAALWIRGDGADAERRGIRVVCSERGYLFGLFFHRIAMDVRHGQVLDVTQLRVLEIGRSDRALLVSLEAAEGLALEQGCSGMLVEILQQGPLGRPAPPILPDLAAARGFQAHCVRLFRPLGGDPVVREVVPFPSLRRRPRLGK
jgi:hypothetical protein